jgi:phosphoglucosamine mutase
MIQDQTLAQKTVVATIMSNMGLEIAMSRCGGKVVRTKVGDRYVVEEMLRGNYNLGGEQSGHLVFRDCSTTGDGILAALNLLKIMAQTQRSVAELKQCMEHLPQILKNVRVTKKLPLEQLPKTKQTLADMSQKLGERGRIVFRYSGTENLLRVMVEGEDQSQIEAFADELIRVAEIEILSQ